MNSPVDQAKVEAIQALYVADEISRKFFDYAASRERNASETRAERASEKLDVAYSDVIRMFKKLDELGLGSFIPGRHGAKTRFRWNFSMRSIGMAAKKEGRQLEAVQATDDTVHEETDSPEMISHTYQIRQNLTIKIELPYDLSEKEADRIASWVRTLPF